MRLLVCYVTLLGGCCALAPTRPPRHDAPFNDPLRLRAWRPTTSGPELHQMHHRPAAAAAGALLAGLGSVGAASAASVSMAGMDPIALDPSNFQPVCPASDGFYRFGQSLITGLVGPDSYKEYAPLIAGGLLRVRLELCVLESFFYEAIIPFIKENGLSWVLPLHETVETFLAGVVFSVATNFILIGSTKILTVIITYADIFVGFPSRTVGGAGWKALEDKAIAASTAGLPEEKPRPWWKGPKPRPEVPLDEVVAANSANPSDKAQLALWGAVLGLGKLSGGVRQAMEFLDIFVGRYLLLTTVTYVGIKFIHFKVFDPFPM